MTGSGLRQAIPELASLRITVFRAYPYLYDGDAAYEGEYLNAHVESPGAIVVGAFDGARMVGAATGAPMEDHAAEFGEPFAAAGYDISKVFYFGESVLLPEYRGRGIGHAFFEARENRGQELGRRWAAFCAVVRPEDHPARPQNYSPLDPFWQKRGYRLLPGVEASFSWKEVGTGAQTTKTMAFWIRDIDRS